MTESIITLIIAANVGFSGGAMHFKNGGFNTVTRESVGYYLLHTDPHLGANCYCITENKACETRVQKDHVAVEICDPPMTKTHRCLLSPRYDQEFYITCHVRKKT